MALNGDVVSIPTITATCTGTADALVTGCADPADNGFFAFSSATFSIPSQSGGTFSGTLTLITNVQGFNISVTDTASGTVDSQGTLSGTLSGQTLINGGFDSAHSVTFTGTLSGNTISSQFTVVDFDGDICTSTGLINVSK